MGSISRSEKNSSAAQAATGDGSPAFVSLRWRRGHRLPLAQLESDVVLVLESGCLTCDAVLPGSRRQILLVLYPGDMLCQSFAPPLTDLRLTATTAVVLKRLRADFTCASEDLLRQMLAAATDLTARTCLSTVVRGRLDAQERLATLLAELALRLGHPAPGGYTFEVPLSRTDMADYLALNADSLSRIMSRFRSSGLISTPRRNRVIAKSLDALLAATPLGPALARMVSPPLGKPDASPALAPR